MPFNVTGIDTSKFTNSSLISDLNNGYNIRIHRVQVAKMALDTPVVSLMDSTIVAKGVWCLDSGP